MPTRPPERGAIGASTPRPRAPHPIAASIAASSISAEPFGRLVVGVATADSNTLRWGVRPSDAILLSCCSKTMLGILYCPGEKHQGRLGKAGERGDGESRVRRLCRTRSVVAHPLTSWNGAWGPAGGRRSAISRQRSLAESEAPCVASSATTGDPPERIGRGHHDLTAIDRARLCRTGAGAVPRRPARRRRGRRYLRA